MRLFLVFLLLLNLLYAVWNYFQPVKPHNRVKALPSDLKSLQMLSEVANDTSVSAEEPVNPVVSQPEQKVVPAEEQAPVEPLPVVRCYTLGPFKDESIMQQLKAVLAEKAQGVEVRKLEESEQHRYWVHIPALKDRAAAKAMTRTLAGKKIKDFYIVRGGENNNRISLGHFREKKHADRRIKLLKKHDIKAEIEIIYRHFNIYWLDYSEVDNQIEGEDFIQEFLIDGVARLNRDCE